jgi:hypothetical protein
MEKEAKKASKGKTLLSWSTQSIEKQNASFFFYFFIFQLSRFAGVRLQSSSPGMRRRARQVSVGRRATSHPVIT